MGFFTKIASAAAGVAAAVSLGLAAQAAVVVSGGPLDFATPVNINNDDMAPGAFMDAGSFDVADVQAGNGAADVRFSSGAIAGIRNMIITFTIAGLADQSFQITDANGLQTLSFFSLQLIPNAIVEFVVTGTVFETLGQQANYNIVITAAPIPLPAAATFLLTGLAAAAGLRLRKKVA